MSAALSSIIFSDPLVTAFENRAHREGLLTECDYKLAEFIKPKAPKFDINEAIALDLLCLYDSVVAEGMRFNLDRMQEFLGEGVVFARGENIRAFTLHFDVFKEKSVGGLNRSAFYRLRGAARFEAQYILRRDIDFYLLDAERKFESEVPRRGWLVSISTDVEPSHKAVSAFLKKNLFWLVDVFDFAYRDGVYNRLVEADDLEILRVPKELRRQFQFFSKTARFDEYFSYIQEAYTSLYENSFLGRASHAEVAYERAPDRRLPSAEKSDAARLSRIVRINLADVVDYFPLPRTIEEAIEFRESPRVEAFKSVLVRWVKSFSSDAKLEAALRKDLILANRDLRLLRSWRSLKSRPIFFGAKTTLQLVPYVGTLLTAFDIIDYFVEHYVESRWAWVVTPHARIDPPSE